MKKQKYPIIWIAAATLTASLFTHKPAIADESICGLYSDYAIAVMKKRQEGLSIRQLLSTTEDSTLRAIIQDAWEEPMWGSEARKHNAVVQFGDEIFIECTNSVAESD